MNNSGRILLAIFLLMGRGLRSQNFPFIINDLKSIYTYESSDGFMKFSFTKKVKIKGKKYFQFLLEDSSAVFFPKRMYYRIEKNRIMAFDSTASWVDKKEFLHLELNPKVGDSYFVFDSVVKKEILSVNDTFTIFGQVLNDIVKLKYTYYIKQQVREEMIYYISKSFGLLNINKLSTGGYYTLIQIRKKPSKKKN